MVEVALAQLLSMLLHLFGNFPLYVYAPGGGLSKLHPSSALKGLLDSVRLPPRCGGGHGGWLLFLCGGWPLFYTERALRNLILSGS